METIEDLINGVVDAAFAVQFYNDQGESENYRAAVSELEAARMSLEAAISDGA